MVNLICPTAVNPIGCSVVLSSFIAVVGLMLGSSSVRAVDTPLCYLQTQSGQMLDLSQICAMSDRTTVTIAIVPYESELTTMADRLGVNLPANPVSNPLETTPTRQCNYLSLDDQNRPCQ
jgi:hypothetical protein